MTTVAQRTMLFALWRDARRLLLGRGLTPQDADAERDALTLRALGVARSWSVLDNGHVDALKAELLAIVHPGDFDAQMEQQQGGRKRRFFVLEELLQRLGKPREYADAVARRMNRESKIGSADLDAVDFEGFDKVLAALRNQCGREKKKADRKAELDQIAGQVFGKPEEPF